MHFIHLIIHTILGLDCDVLDTIENGYIEYSDGTVYQSVATYNCHIGHNLAMSGNEMRTCESDGMWDGTAPTCNSEYLPLYNFTLFSMYIKTPLPWQSNYFLAVYRS